MTVPINAQLSRRNNANFALVDDGDFGGGFRVVADQAARTAIPTSQLKVGMQCCVQADIGDGVGRVYQLSVISPATWALAVSAGVGIAWGPNDSWATVYAAITAAGSEGCVVYLGNGYADAPPANAYTVPAGAYDLNNATFFSPGKAGRIATAAGVTFLDDQTYAGNIYLTLDGVALSATGTLNNAKTVNLQLKNGGSLISGSSAMFTAVGDGSYLTLQGDSTVYIGSASPVISLAPAANLGVFGDESCLLQAGSIAGSGTVTFNLSGGARNSFGAPGGSVTYSDVTGLTALRRCTDANRPAANAVIAGTIIFNTDDNFPNVSDGANWRNMSGVIT